MSVGAATTGAVFHAYLEQVLLPELRRSKPDAVLVMDNLGAHKTPKVRGLLDRSGFPYRYLPSYSPDLVWGSCGQEESDGYIRFSSGRDGVCGQGRSRGAGPKAPSAAYPPLLPSWRRPMRQTRRGGHGCSSLAVAPSRRSIVAHHGNRW
jgi:hypothetical protein